MCRTNPGNPDERPSRLHAVEGLSVRLRYRAAVRVVSKETAKMMHPDHVAIVKTMMVAASIAVVGQIGVRVALHFFGG